MRFRINISKMLVYRLMLLMALTGTAMLFDVYFENHPVVLEKLETESKQEEAEPGLVYLISQTNSFTVKSPVQKAPGRKIIAQAHDKYLQQSHQLRDHQAYKAERDVPRKPVWLSCHNLLFRQNYFAFPDDEPLIS